MNDRWYYAHDGNKIGPFSGRQLLDLAVVGEILRTDTVWKEGIEKGVLATRVQYLFPARTPSAVCLPAAVQPVAVPLPIGAPAENIPDDIGLKPEAIVPVNPNRMNSQPHPALKRRAVVVKGAVIVGQDGMHVKFRKKCTGCGYEDSSWSTLPITLGSIKAMFFCPKCRKREAVEMQGFQR